MAKTISLYLYEDIQPNYNNTYYLTNSTQDIKTHLTSYLSATISADNYRVNSNVIKIKNEGTNYYNNITYAIEEIIEEGSLIYWRCYHVKSIDYQSSYTILYCEVDIWGTYFHNATLNNIVVNQCNRAIGNGFYNDIKHGEIDYTKTTSAVAPVNLDLLLYFKLEGYTQDTFIGRISIASIKNIAMLAPFTDIIKIETFIKLINKMRPTGSTDPADEYNFTLVDAYIVPHELLVNSDKTRTIGGVTYQYKFDVQMDNIWYTEMLIQCTPSNCIVTKNIVNTTITTNLDYKLYLGALNNTIEIPRYVKKAFNYYLNFTINYDSPELLIGYDNNSRNITDNIHMALQVTKTELGGLYNINTAINRLGSIIQNSGLNYGKNIAQGDFWGVGKQAMSDLSYFFKNETTYYTSTGNALTTYMADLSKFLNIYYVKSLEDEKANARIFGARFSEEISSIYNVFSSALLGTGSLASTYIKATCNVDEVPTDACDFIQNVLNSGAYFIDIRPNDNN